MNARNKSIHYITLIVIALNMSGISIVAYHMQDLETKENDGFPSATYNNKQQQQPQHPLFFFKSSVIY